MHVMQRAACGLDNGSSNTETMQEEQEERLLYMAQVADMTIRARVLSDSAASSFLKDQSENSSKATLRTQSEE